MCEAGRGLHGLLAVFSSAALRRRLKRHSTQKPDREPRELAPLLPAPTVLCITAVIFHKTDSTLGYSLFAFSIVTTEERSPHQYFFTCDKSDAWSV